MVDYKELLDLTGNVTIVTGAGTGLGKELCNAFSQFGSNIVAADIDLETAKQTAEEIEETNKVKVLPFKVDVSKEEDVRALIKETINEFGKIDNVFNNAGICKKIKAEDMSLEDWQRTMDVNVNGPFLVSKYAGIEMMKTGGGSIINMASMSSFIANTEAQCAYNSSKAAVVMMTKCLASEWVNHNIRVNAIAPGYMRTAMAEPLFEEGGELRHVLNLIPMKRLGEPFELGAAAVFLASKASSFTTGSVFVIDGGYTVW